MTTDNSPNSEDGAADDGRDDRHKARMVRKKDVVDQKIAAAQIERGVIVITTGNGKGKSSSGFGMVVRAMGHGMKTAVVQFIKGAIPSGEEQFLRRFPEECAFHVMGEGYTWETQDRSRDVAKAEAAWDVARGLLSDPTVSLVLLDELNIALKLHYLDVDRVIADLRARPPMQHVVITGRGAPQALIDAADTVTDMTLVKHAFKAGVKAQRGVEM
ncbi:cob(I)yrinic acid a,c-diamide adenosyltransferase [Cupriavidus plantarum]|uniref:Corrinoid adenosyltransferase n=2 Tax=Cupriavidus plantarum TaxID=942865 RepID=A0A316FFM5_9BURK|nr:cob(I)yrinic acid a,c-diamide adenosyltransferase [Cupriavidus plantarum]NYH99221.1 cob(I)alamin adenosyltransferase [Cupriavidus plantarum]PWK36460.1 cob(I)yrinic acid a,c-diamide adenosyltransferase [Cupriavidus plantarum]REF02802.1 cob(I)yrinic acid a,c-diamide adenosyltransferase [Cupriavidus plantarum]RLK44334.1 cob(I)yrinic acid a,c-diamide adenosyltransferase [Cupriavidus plantarum]CAG2142588.1 Corrinoid adenosyltransferase [Cupriavidus plantarum]